MREISLLHVASESIGYGRLGIMLHRELERIGVDVYDRFDGPDGDSAYTPAQRALNSGRRQKRTNVTCWVSVPGHARGWWEGQHAGIFTMYETMHLPAVFRESLHNFDTVIVPSHQNVELFSAYHPNVRYCQLGIDPQVWHYTPRRPPEREFRFLIGGSGARKGTDLAYKAFRKVFKTWPQNGPVPKLIMKSPKPEDFYGPNIERVGGRIEPADEVALYESAHVYLQPSRGEGFGLQPLQAIAQGIPTVLTNAHGHSAYAHLGYGLDTKPSPAAYFVHGPSGDWWEPDFDQLCEYMAWLYCEYDSVLEQAEKNAHIATSEFTWEISARQFIDCFDGALDQPYQGTDVWFTPELKRYLVITDRDWRADIAGVSYFFEKGRHYHELADVKRLLWEGGYLDPICCVGDDTGLTEEQLKHIDAYSAAHSYCSQCGQQLGSGLTKADELFRQLEAMT